MELNVERFTCQKNCEIYEILAVNFTYQHIDIIVFGIWKVWRALLVWLLYNLFTNKIRANKYVFTYTTAVIQLSKHTITRIKLSYAYVAVLAKTNKLHHYFWENIVCVRSDWLCQSFLANAQLLSHQLNSWIKC